MKRTADDLVEKMEEEGFDADDARQWLKDVLCAHDLIEFDDKHWVVRKRRNAFDEYDYPVSYEH